MSIKSRKYDKPAALSDVHETCHAAVEEILEKNLDNLATILAVSDNGKSKLQRGSHGHGGKGSVKIARARAPVMSKAQRPLIWASTATP
jgi:hypothetical protein